MEAIKEQMLLEERETEEERTKRRAKEASWMQALIEDTATPTSSFEEFDEEDEDEARAILMVDARSDLLDRNVAVHISSIGILLGWFCNASVDIITERYWKESRMWPLLVSPLAVALSTSLPDKFLHMSRHFLCWS